MAAKIVICGITCLIIFGGVISDSDLPFDDDSESSPLSKTCMKCICKVMGCIKDEGCVGDTCGVMHITQNYWEMAYNRRQGTANTEAYQKCSNNVWCATRTVQLYMTQFLPACETKRRDRLRCENAMALHKYGRGRCHHELTESTKRQLLTCLDQTVWQWLGDE